MEITILVGVIFIATICLLIVHKAIKIHLILYGIREELSDLKIHLSMESVNVFRRLQVLPDLAGELELPNRLPQMRGGRISGFPAGSFQACSKDDSRQHSGVRKW